MLAEKESTFSYHHCIVLLSQLGLNSFQLSLLCTELRNVCVFVCTMHV